VNKASFLYRRYRGFIIEEKYLEAGSANRDSSLTKFVFQKNQGKFNYVKNYSDTFDKQKFARKVDLIRTHSLLKTGPESHADQSDIVDWADEPIDDSNTRSCDDDAEAKIKMDDSRSQPSSSPKILPINGTRLY
jgi:hypothetical protein